MFHDAFDRGPDREVQHTDEDFFGGGVLAAKHERNERTKPDRGEFRRPWPSIYAHHPRVAVGDKRTKRVRLATGVFSDP